jgi:hypothetical protein
MDLDARRAQLTGWLDKSRRTRAKIVTGAAVGTVFGLFGLILVGGPIGAVVLMLPIAFGLCGAWITTAHMLTFKGQIKDLEHVKEHGIPVAVRQGRGRQGGRYQK